MNPEVWKRVVELYELVRGLDEPQRRKVLTEAAETDPRVAAEVRKLLSSPPPSAFLDPAEPAIDAAHTVDLYFGGGLSGTQLGDFVLEREIGRGGMGVVYLANQVELDRKVAVKILPIGKAHEPDITERFRREVKAASRLDHQHIVPVLAFGETQGSLWYAMRFVEGHDVSQEIEHQRGPERGRTSSALFPPYETPSYTTFVIERVAELCDAVHYAHREGIVHRDIKPQNILLASDGSMHLADFGLALDDRFGTLSRTGDIRGTPFYMSPEQAKAARSSVDHRTDVYSLSVVLYELLALRRPYEGRSSREVLDKITQREAEPLQAVNPKIARDLSTLCAKGMSKLPADRYASAGELGADLGRFLRHEAILAKPPTRAQRLRRWIARHRLSLAGTVIGAALLALGVAWSSLQTARAATRDLRDTLAAVMELEEWDEATEALIELRNKLRSLTPAGVTQSDSLHGSLLAFTARLAEHRAKELARGNHLIERGIGRQHLSEFGEYTSPNSPSDLSRGLLLLQRLRLVFWDDPEVLAAARIERTFPRVSVTAVPLALRGELTPIDGATVSLRKIDPFHESLGPPEVLGTLPLESLPVPPGHYRILVDVPGVGRGELTRALMPQPTPHRLLVRVVPTGYGQAGMLAVEAGTLELPPTPPMGCLRVDRSVELSAYWLDECEVSNGDFVEFLAASGHPVPFGWTLVGYRADWRDLPLSRREAEWLELPVVAIGWEDARAYAEWHGKRLPTHVELEYAFRGTDAQTQATRASADFSMLDSLPLANVMGPLAGGYPNNDLRTGYEIYLINALPVRHPRFRQPPRGLFHAHGNVDELTETWFIDPVGNQLTLFPNSRIKYGTYWGAETALLALDTHAPIGADADHFRTQTGFRCARSAW